MYSKLILLFFLLNGIIPINAASYKDSLKAYWDFETIKNNQLIDLSGNNNNGFFPYYAPQVVDGKVGKCLRFSGNSYVELYNKYFMNNQCNLTMTCWFKIEASTYDYYQLFCISGSEPWMDPMTFQFNNRKPSDFAFEDCVNGVNAIRSNPKNFKFEIKQNEWYFLTVVLCSDQNLSTMKLYLNGELAETVNIISTMSSYQPIGPGKVCPTFHKPMTATIGALVNYPDWNWIGCIDDMKFYSTCLTDGEIMQEYTNDCDSSYFEYTDFKSANDIKLNGNASMDNSSVNICSNGEFYTGSVWHTQDIPVSAGFTSTWEFSIDSSDGGKYPDASEPGADGITFLIQNATNTTNAIGSYGSGIGYEGIDNALAVEIDLFTNDSYQNDDKLDPNGNHLAIMGTTPKTTLKSLHSPKYQIWSTTSIPVIKSNGTKYYAKVEYDATKKTFDAWVSETSTFGEPNIHLSNFNIKSYLSLINGTNAYVGFTSSTGSAFQNHKLHNWYFCPKTPSGINNVPADELSEADIISPNPAGNSVNITLPEGFEDFAELEIFNAIGQKVYATELFSNNTNISVSELHDGLYFVVIKSGTKTQTAKLVIKR